jgi:hypothetical protein
VSSRRTETRSIPWIAIAAAIAVTLALVGRAIDSTPLIVIGVAGLVAVVAVLVQRTRRWWSGSGRRQLQLAAATIAVIIVLTVAFVLLG